MDNCKECLQIQTMFDTIGKTYYRIDEEKVLCYRHWHQANRPKFVHKGDYREIFSNQSIAKVKDINKDEKFKNPKRIWNGI